MCCLSRTLVTSLGADTFADYSTTKLSEAVAPRSVDVFMGCVGGSGQWVEAQKVLKQNGHFITVVGDVAGQVAIGALLQFALSFAGRKVLSALALRPRYSLHLIVGNCTHLDQVDDFIRAGTVKVNIAARYAFNLTGAVALFEQSLSGRTTGKLVLDIIADNASKN